MPTTVGVNSLSVVHKGSNGITTAFPDVCKTPTPARARCRSRIPTSPSPRDTAKGTKKVKCDGNPVCVKDSNFSMSTGDEAGSAGGGVASNKIKGKAEFVNFSFDVKFEGKNVCARVRPDAAQRQEHAAVPGDAGAGHRHGAAEADLSRL